MRFFLVWTVLPFLFTETLALGEQKSLTPDPATVAYGKKLKCYYGAIGFVEKKGVFEFSAPCANLEELVQRAGGLSKNATGNLKIVHADGTESHTFYSPALQQKLLPNDILVVEGIFDHSERERQGIPLQNRIRIGLINLVDRPVILKVRRDLTSVDRLLKYLHQPPELVGSLRTVQPTGSPLQKTKTAKQFLVDGSIIVFAPGSTNKEEIPFHAVFEPMSVAQVPANLMQRTNHVRNSRFSRSAKSRMSNSKDSDVSSAQFDLQPTSSKSDRHRVTNLSPGWATESTSSHQADEESKAELAAIARVDDGNSEDTSSTSQTIAAIDSIQLDEDQSTGDHSTSRWKQKLASPMFVTILSILGLVVLFSGFLLRSIFRTSQAVEQTRLKKTRQRNYLKSLIEDDIPIVSLEVQHPGNFKLFDKAKGEKYLRIDAAHQIRRPQFLPRKPQLQEKPESGADRSLQYDTIFPPNETPVKTETVERQTENRSEASESENHEIPAPHFFKKRHTPLPFRPHTQTDDFIQKVLDRVHREEKS